MYDTPTVVGSGTEWEKLAAKRCAYDNSQPSLELAFAACLGTVDCIGVMDNKCNGADQAYLCMSTDDIVESHLDEPSCIYIRNTMISKCMVCVAYFCVQQLYTQILFGFWISVFSNN